MRNGDAVATLILMAVIALVGAAIGFAIGVGFESGRNEREAVAIGVGRYVLDRRTKAITFEWITTKGAETP